MKAFPLLLILLFVPSASAGFNTHTTAQGHRATVSFPDVVNLDDEFMIVANADAGTSGLIGGWGTAPTGWTFVGCAFISVDQNQAGNAQRTQAVRLKMTDDTCTFYSEITWHNLAGTTNAVTTLHGSIVTDEQDQNLFAKEFVQPIAWLAWLAYLVLLYRVKHEPLRVVGVVVGFSIVLLPMPQLQTGILLAGQLAVAVVFVVQLIKEKNVKP